MISPAMQLLYDEHEVILQAAAQLETLLADESHPLASGDLNRYVQFFREYGDQYHHHKEEEILFTLLREENEMLGETLVAALTEHHEQFRENLGEAAAAIEQQDWERARKVLRDYLLMLRDHISAENDELFVTADAMLSPEQKERLYFSFLDKDRELGEARKQEFERGMEQS